MASADEAHSRPKRPTAMARQSSSQSHLSQSPSEGHHRHQHKPHVVGQRQRVQRNTSFGKNLNKLNKAVKESQQNTENSARHHRRTQSGNSISAPSSPRPSFKRNASSGGIVRANQQAQGQAHLRKNHSSGHLARHVHGKHGRASKHDLAAAKRALGNPNRSRPTSPEGHATVHFDVADEEEGADDGWTEESASQSPTTTRSNTRSNSVVLEAQHRIAQENMERNSGMPPQGATQETLDQASQTLVDRTRNNTRVNGGSSQQHQHSRPPDADMITSRLLQRSTSHNITPQTSTATATVVSSTNRHNLLSHSAGSTLVDTPGRDLVSRFMDGDGSAGTPRDGTFMPSQNSSSPHDSGGDLDKSKRNKSMPNVSGADTPSKTPQRSGTTTPTTTGALPPSRTQQKLMLQRASSVIEPQKLIPVTLPRTGGPNFLHSGIHYSINGEGRLDPRLQQAFNHVAVEYKVVRRYRNPLADAVGRIGQMPGISKRAKIPPSSSKGSSSYVNIRGSVHGNGSGSQTGSLSTSLNNEGEMDGTREAGARRSRDGPEESTGTGRPASVRSQAKPGSRDGGASSHGSQRRSVEEERHGDAEEICRRLWESAEVSEAD